MIEARLNWDHFAVDLKGHTSLVRPFPISVEGRDERRVPADEELKVQMGELDAQYGLEDLTVILGVDGIDYTKGLPERFRAMGRMFDKHPELRERVTLVEPGALSRTHIRRYCDLLTDLESMANEINWRFQTENWKPIHFLAAHHDARTVHAFMRMAAVCAVSSLHDGMSLVLVAKEFVAAKDEDDGVLVLSEFAGAARELADAIFINLKDTEQFAEALYAAVTMEPAERAERMARMRRTVEEHNIYYWAANFVTALGAARQSTPRATAVSSPRLVGAPTAPCGVRVGVGG